MYEAGLKGGVVERVNGRCLCRWIKREVEREGGGKGRGGGGEL